MRKIRFSINSNPPEDLPSSSFEGLISSYLQNSIGSVDEHETAGILQEKGFRRSVHYIGRRWTASIAIDVWMQKKQ